MRSAKTCPICGKPRSTEHHPFCSTRCKDRDLVNWLQDGYAIPGAHADEQATIPTGEDEEDD